MVRQAGIEPATPGLIVECPRIELGNTSVAPPYAHPKSGALPTELLAQGLSTPLKGSWIKDF